MIPINDIDNMSVEYQMSHFNDSLNDSVTSMTVGGHNNGAVHLKHQAIDRSFLDASNLMKE